MVGAGLGAAKTATAGDPLSLTARRYAARFFFRVGAAWGGHGPPQAAPTRNHLAKRRR